MSNPINVEMVEETQENSHWCHKGKLGYLFWANLLNWEQLITGTSALFGERLTMTRESWFFLNLFVSPTLVLESFNPRVITKPFVFDSIHDKLLAILFWHLEELLDDSLQSGVTGVCIEASWDCWLGSHIVVNECWIWKQRLLDKIKRSHKYQNKIL